MFFQIAGLSTSGLRKTFRWVRFTIQVSFFFSLPGLIHIFLWIDVDNFLPSISDRYRQMLLPVLRLINSVFVSVGNENRDAAEKVHLSFLPSNSLLPCNVFLLLTSLPFLICFFLFFVFCVFVFCCF